MKKISLKNILKKTFKKSKSKKISKIIKVKKKATANKLIKNKNKKIDKKINKFIKRKIDTSIKKKSPITKGEVKNENLRISKSNELKPEIKKILIPKNIEGNPAVEKSSKVIEKPETDNK